MTSCENINDWPKRLPVCLILLSNQYDRCLVFRLHVLITAYTSSEDPSQLWRQNKMDLVFIVSTDVGLLLLRTKLNFYLSLSKFSRRQLIFFLIFPRKKSFDISWKLSPKEKICMKWQSLFSGTNTKTIWKCWKWNAVRWNCYPAC